MIRPLRVRHRAMTLVLAVAVPAGFVLGLVARHPSRIRALAGRGADTDEAAAAAVRLEGLALRARIEPDGAAPMLFLLPEEDLREPDVLVYLTRATGPFDAIPEDALLLGVLSGAHPRRFTLPPDGRWDGASVVLYSLGHQELLGSAPLPRTE